MTPDSGDSLCQAALAASGSAAFVCKGAGHGAMAWQGDLASLDLQPAEHWDSFVEAFVEADQHRVRALRNEAAGAGEPVVLVARLASQDGQYRRVRLRVGPAAGDAGAIAGLITPAFGAHGEVVEHGRLDLEPALREAAARQDFEAWFQPIIALKGETVAGFEALIRWPHPERGLLRPDEFLPLAEELGLIAGLGDWMRAVAAAQQASWRKRGGFVSVNVTTAELEEPSLAARTHALIAQHQLAPGALKLEVTEGQVMRDPDAAERMLRALKDAGASLALDDFGAGFSSLARLGRFPFDTVKIDRYFIRTLDASRSSRAIVESIVNLAHELDMTVVAEGVETRAQAAQLAALGCDYAQGFRFAPALTAREASLFAA